MPFPQLVKEEALVKSRRCCCICHEFFGRAVEVHHITPEADGGPNQLDNAVVLCERCHSEVGHYNSRHPIGNKYHPSEVKKHRDVWWAWCEANPYAPLPKEPVSVSPSKIELVKDALQPMTWKTRPTRLKPRVPITIQNKTTQALFDVDLGIVLSLTNIDVDAIDLTLFDTEVAPPTQGRESEVAHVGFTGLLSNGEYIIVRHIDVLNPHQVLKCNLRVLPDTQVDAATVATARIQIFSVAAEPSSEYFIEEVGRNRLPSGELGIESRQQIRIPENLPGNGSVTNIRIMVQNRGRII